MVRFPFAFVAVTFGAGVGSIVFFLAARGIGHRRLHEFRKGPSVCAESPRAFTLPAPALPVFAMPALAIPTPGLPVLPTPVEGRSPGPGVGWSG